MELFNAYQPGTEDVVYQGVVFDDGAVAVRKAVRAGHSSYQLFLALEPAREFLQSFDIVWVN